MANVGIKEGLSMRLNVIAVESRPGRVVGIYPCIFLTLEFWSKLEFITVLLPLVGGGLFFLAAPGISVLGREPR